MKYAFTACQKQVNGRVFWVAASTVLEGCVGQGETAAEAVRELETNEGVWIDTAKKYGIPIPEAKPEQMEPMTWEGYKAHVRNVDPQAGRDMTEIEAVARSMTALQDAQKAFAGAAEEAGLQTEDDLAQMVSAFRSGEDSESGRPAWYFHKAASVETLPDCRLRVVFKDGVVKTYDMKQLFADLPQLKALAEDPDLFASARLDPGGYGIIWNDELDLDCNEIYVNGEDAE